MKTFDDLVARCKCSVTLTVNDYRDDYARRSDWLDVHGYDLTPAEHERLQAVPDLYELQFYPETPIGFYRVLGASLDEVVAQAHAILDGEGK